MGPGINLSYAEMDEAAVKLAFKLRSLGIPRQTVISSVIRNNVGYAVLFLAVTHAALIAAPLNPDYPREEVEFYLKDVGSKLLVVPEGWVKMNKEAVQAARNCNCNVMELYWNENKKIFDVDYADPADERGFCSDWNVDEKNDVALILHTSGTTGRPKGCLVA